jgi:tripartite-type tricarboxylate transporter receptor subunit TctC
VKFTHIPYKGGGPSVTATISGEVQFAIPAFPTAAAHVKAGRLRILAVTGTERSPVMPDVPTVAEAGVPGYEFVLWFGVFAPSGTPKAIITRLNQATVKALQSSDVQKQLSAQGLDPHSSTPEALQKQLRTDIEKWARIIKSAGIKTN